MFHAHSMVVRVVGCNDVCGMVSGVVGGVPGCAWYRLGSFATRLWEGVVVRTCVQGSRGEGSGIGSGSETGNALDSVPCSDLWHIYCALLLQTGGNAFWTYVTRDYKGRGLHGMREAGSDTTCPRRGREGGHWSHQDLLMRFVCQLGLALRLACVIRSYHCILIQGVTGLPTKGASPGALTRLVP